MCGRFTLTQLNSLNTATLNLPLPPLFTPRYNIAPTQQILTIINDIHPQWKWMHWGLIPSWADDPKIGNRLINARAETLLEKRSFRNPFKKRRCLILADGFYEWLHEGKTKQPLYFQMKNNQPFAFAGLWETWTPKNSDPIISAPPYQAPLYDGRVLSSTIITTTANDIVKLVHNRMPVILPPDSYEQWLDPNTTTTESRKLLLKPFPSQEMKITPVTTVVNNPAKNSPECIQPS